MKTVRLFRFVVGVCAVASLLAAGSAGASVPRTMSYQGLLTDTAGGAVPDGTHDLQFALYDVPAAGAALWTEMQASVPVAAGLVAVLLGSVTPLDLPFNEPYWLGVSVDGGAELAPRLALSSSPYSLTIGDEPGIAQARSSGNEVIGNTGALVRELTVTIAIPGPGYIALDASGMIGFNGASGEQSVVYGIVESTALTFPPQAGHYYYCGFGTVPNGNYLDFPFFCRRTYYKSAAGTYSFSLGTGRLGSFSSSTYTFNPVLNAVFYPTAYGAVATAAADAPVPVVPQLDVQEGQQP
jgi:hypothetical protein